MSLDARVLSLSGKKGLSLMETQAHRTLKVGAVSLLLRAGCVAATTEVRCPIARHRVDVAGYLDPLPKHRSAASEEWQTIGGGLGIDLRLARDVRPRTVIVECKQSRGDFLSDSRDVDELLAERERLERVRRVLEDQIVKVCEPHLRRSGSRLFAELEEWDFGRSRVASYRGVLNDLRRIDERMYGERKFWTMAHYRLADWLYLAAPTGVIRTREVPAGWGLLEMSPGWEKGPRELRVRVPAPLQSGKVEHRQRLLRNIAVAASRRGIESAAMTDGDEE
jgi:hypothetical protein